jgi:transglutaminase-like putative cysteine protease
VRQLSGGGSKSNLFIALCRINHIPARSQGGWRVQPDGDHAQHSWAQVYFEPYGWMPVDATAGAHLINHKDERVRYFYFGNCTPYHLIIYDDDEELLPPKTFELLYGGGAQLGAFEWRGGDIEPNIRIDSHVE